MFKDVQLYNSVFDGLIARTNRYMIKSILNKRCHEHILSICAVGVKSCQVDGCPLPDDG